MNRQEKNAILEHQVELLIRASYEAASLPQTSALADITEALIDCLSAIDEEA